MKRLGSLYIIVNTLTGRTYVGITTRSFRSRKARHLERLRSNQHRNRLLQADWNKFGEEVFSFKVVQRMNSGLLRERERGVIGRLKLLRPLYNIHGVVKNRPMQQELKEAHSG